MKGDNLIVDMGSTDDVMPDKAVLSSFERWSKETSLEIANGTQ